MKWTDAIFMKSRSRDAGQIAPAQSDSLGRVLGRSKRIKEAIKQAASRLTSVNAALKQRKRASSSVKTIQDAIIQNEDVEAKVARAADDLGEVNSALAVKVAEQTVVESELADTRSDLADTREDLSRSQAIEGETRQLSLHDTLTGLPNRALFEEGLDHALAQAKRHGWGLALLFVDIDEFKSINDSLGHDVGDKALVMVADRLRSSVRDQDIVSRWGGDEFACLLLEVKREGDAVRVAEKMVGRIAEDCEFSEAVPSMRASIGIAMYPADGETADMLFKKADTAMYRAKGAEKRVALFSASASD
jgi:diguanylate cyclase (GGDEF)-like protein